MKILLHDYSGHAFLVQLARRLASEGHEVLHVHFPGFQTPKGVLSRRPDDPPGFETRGLALDEPFAKYSYIKRLRQEFAYGRRLAATIESWRPDVVFSANSPLDPQDLAQRAALRRGIPFVFWVQDIYSVAIANILRRRLPVVGHLVGARYVALEKRLLRRSARIIAITDDFLPVLERWGIPRERMEVVENWAAREELPPRPKDNPWSRAHSLQDRLVFLYSGSIGLKHDPDLLLAVARAFPDRPDVRVVVISEGPAMEWLATHGAGLSNLVLLPFQPFDVLPDVVGTGDVLMAVLDPEAGIYSVPSKVLTYLCAGRPLLAAMPPENLASRILSREQAGLVAPAGDREAFVAAARRLAGDPSLRASLGGRALEYAARTFDIAAVSRRIQDIAKAAMAGRSAS
ncbi:MAG: glycosyltransferase family 4 protein [Verrucomicrobiae bacterium]|nr:glycosyltransferase family 4 protein [Verrucomicrobiae bacterium]